MALFKQTFQTKRGLIQLAFKVATDLLFGDGKIYVLNITEWQPKRSLAQNSLYWRWLKEIATYVNESTGKEFTDEDFHEYFKSLYIDYEIKEIFGKKIYRYKTTTKLGIKRFSEYLQCIEYWCGDKEIPLTRPIEYEVAIKGKRYGNV